MAQALMHLEHLSLGYGRGTVVQDVSGVLHAGSLTALIGANGAGKSTLLQGLAGILSPTQGKITHQAGLSVDYLPQIAALHDALPLSLFDFVAFTYHVNMRFYERLSPLQVQAISQALKQMRLFEMRHTPFSTLSGGQKQRALFARFLLSNADLILMDEPFSALDAMTIENALLLIKKRVQTGKACVMIVHDYELVRRHFKECIILGRSLIAWGETKLVLTGDNLHRAHHFKEALAEEALDV